MRYRFFAIPARAPDDAEQALNAFCAGHRVVTADRHLVPDGSESFWAICVIWLEGAASASSAAGKSGKGGRVDYRETLPEADFAVFASLRVLRKRLAEEEGIPPYAVFTNEQLAAMVTRRAASPAALGEIDGVGEARLAKYGGAFLEALQKSGIGPA